MIPVSEPLIGEAERRYVDEAVRSGWISSEGPFVARFEEAWAAYCGVRHGVAISSGTTALFAAIAALDLAPGDEVILPTFTYIGCVHAITAVGALPVLVDADPETWCMDVAQTAARVTARTRAIMPVHIYGHPVEMEPLRDLAARHGLTLVEDAAEAHGATYHGRRTGALGDVACFSFYANKIITTGEGGMVVTDDDRLAARVREYRNMAFQPGRRFSHERVGYNYRLTSLQAAVGLAQVESVEARVRRKRGIGARYTALLQGMPGLALPVERAGATNVYWMYGIVLDDGVPFDAAECAARLLARGVDTRPFFLGMHEQPVFHAAGLFRGERYPVAERLARRGLYLPSGLTLTDGAIEQVVAAVRAVLGA